MAMNPDRALPPARGAARALPPARGAARALPPARGAARALGVAVATILVASCSSSPDPATGRQAVLDAYRQSWADIVAVGDPVNPDAPELRVHRSGQSLDIIVAVLRDYKAKGVVFRGQVELHPKIIEMTSDKVKIRDCVFDHTEALDPMTNQIVKPAASHPVVANTTMQVIKGAWKSVNFVPQNQECKPEA